MSNPDSSTRPSQDRREHSCNCYPSHILGLMVAALILIAGMYLGRYLTKAEMQSQLASHETETLSLQAQIASLSPQPAPRLAHGLAHDFSVVQRTDRFAHVTEHPAFERQEAAATRTLIDLALERTAADRQTCLDELQQRLQGTPAVSAAEVIRFVDGMLDRRRQMLISLATGNASAITGLPTLPSWSAIPPDESGHDELTADTDHANRGTSAASLGVRSGETSGSRSSGKETGRLNAQEAQRSRNALTGPVFAAAESTCIRLGQTEPRRKGYTFITPRRTTRTVAGKPSGFQFRDGDDATGERAIR